jgi:hypothetical protein
MASGSVAGKRCAKVGELFLGRGRKTVAQTAAFVGFKLTAGRRCVQCKLRVRPCDLESCGEADSEGAFQRKCGCKMIVFDVWWDVGGGRCCCGTLS